MPKRSPSVLSFGSRIVDKGPYGTIRSFGDLEASGDLHATRIRSFGDGEIHGRCSVKHLFTAGNLHIHDSLHAPSIRSFGNVIVNGQLTTTQLRIMGDLSVTGRVSCQRLRLWGNAMLDEDVVSEEVKLTGTCRIRGLVSAERIQIRSRGQCQLNEIGGAVIAIRSGWNEDGCPNSRSFLNWRCRGTTRVHLIEGDRIYLENTAADIVRGQTITLGSGCRIGTIEYTVNLTQHPSSEVECVQQVLALGNQLQDTHQNRGHNE